MTLELLENAALRQLDGGRCRLPRAACNIGGVGPAVELGGHKPVKLRIHRLGDHSPKLAVHPRKLVMHLGGDELAEVYDRHKRECDGSRERALSGEEDGWDFQKSHP